MWNSLINIHIHIHIHIHININIIFLKVVDVWTGKIQRLNVAQSDLFFIFYRSSDAIHELNCLLKHFIININNGGGGGGGGMD